MIPRISEMVKLVRQEAKQSFCSHAWTLERGVYGDEINLLNCRELQVCPKCGKRRRNRMLP